MKIALCKSHFFGPVSGADEILVTYAIRLHQAGHDVHVVLLYKPAENDRYYERLRQSGVAASYIIQRSFAFMILRSLRRVISSFFLLFLLIPRSEVRLRKIWQVMMDLISRVHYSNCRAYDSRWPRSWRSSSLSRDGDTPSSAGPQSVLSATGESTAALLRSRSTIASPGESMVGPFPFFVISFGVTPDH